MQISCSIFKLYDVQNSLIFSPHMRISAQSKMLQSCQADSQRKGKNKDKCDGEKINTLYAFLLQETKTNKKATIHTAPASSKAGYYPTITKLLSPYGSLSKPTPAANTSSSLIDMYRSSHQYGSHVIIKCPPDRGRIRGELRKCELDMNKYQICKYFSLYFESTFTNCNVRYTCIRMCQEPLISVLFTSKG